MSDNGVVWEDPPPSRRHRHLWVERLEPLISHPGNWAKVYEGTNLNSISTQASHLRHGHIHVPAGRWEFTCRSLDGRTALYARYLGPEEEVKA